MGISNIDEASGRSFATLGQPNFLGQWLIFPFIALFVKIFNEQKWRDRNIFIFLIVVTGAALATTLNRASIIGISLSLILFLIYKFKSKISAKTFIAGGILLAISIALVIFSGGLRSVNSRLTLIKPVIPLAQEHMLIGAGPETMYQTYQKVLSKDIYITENLYDIPDRIHNETLQVLLDQGLIGLVLYLFLIGCLLILFFKKENFSYEENSSYFSLIAYFISMQFSFSISAHVTILMAALAVLLSNKLKFAQKIIDLKNIFLQISLKILLLIFCIFYLYNGLAILMADVYFSKGIDSYFSQNDESVNYFDSSIKTNPHSRYYLYNASNLLAAKAVGDKSVDLKIEGYLEKLGQVTNYGYNYYLASAGYYSRIKDFKKENESFQKASEQAPNWPFVWQEWGMNLFEEGNYVEAIGKYEKLMSLAPVYWKWSEGLENRSFEDKEKYRLFRKNNNLFYMSMNQLSAAYAKTGAIDKSNNLLQYLK
ncbi:MAG: O-antigen ligase family protein [Candidatus Peregrinibacteria bacterium]|nr:O-antigen ligase family protein [Candidatus Peregrinibacteria bacterium]